LPEYESKPLRSQKEKKKRKRRRSEKKKGTIHFLLMDNAKSTCRMKANELPRVAQGLWEEHALELE